MSVSSDFSSWRTERSNGGMYHLGQLPLLDLTGFKIQGWRPQVPRPATFRSLSRRGPWLGRSRRTYPTSLNGFILYGTSPPQLRLMRQTPLTQQPPLQLRQRSLQQGQRLGHLLIPLLDAQSLGEIERWNKYSSQKGFDWRYRNQADPKYIDKSWFTELSIAKQHALHFLTRNVNNLVWIEENPLHSYFYPLSKCRQINSISLLRNAVKIKLGLCIAVRKLMWRIANVERGSHMYISSPLNIKIIS